MNMLATAALLLAMAPAPQAALAFIEDDYGKALAQAKARSLSMQAFVFTDESLRAEAGQPRTLSSSHSR